MGNEKELNGSDVPLVQNIDDSDQNDESSQSQTTLEQVASTQWKIVDLPIVPIINGQENQDKIAQFKVCLYRWKETQSEWVERGFGILKFLAHKLDGITRLVMRSNKTFLCVANHRLVKQQPYCQLQKSKTNQRSWLWRAYDCSNLEPKMEIFCARLKTQDQSNKFQQIFLKSCSNNYKIISEPQKTSKAQF